MNLARIGPPCYWLCIPDPLVWIGLDYGLGRVDLLIEVCRISAPFSWVIVVGPQWCIHNLRCRGITRIMDPLMGSPPTPATASGHETPGRDHAIPVPGQGETAQLDAGRHKVASVTAVPDAARRRVAKGRRHSMVFMVIAAGAEKQTEGQITWPSVSR